MTIQQAKEKNIPAEIYAGIKYKSAFESVVNSVLDARKLKLEELQVKCRKRNLVETRQIIYYFCDKYKVGTQIEIAKLFKQDHATLIHAREQISGFIKNDRMLRNELEIIESEILKRLNI